MSGVHVGRLKRRALNMLNATEHVGDHDLALFLLEQAVQLSRMSTLSFWGSKIRGHGLRELIGALAKGLESQGYTEQASRLREFVMENRDVLVELEEAYIESRYGEVEYSAEEAARARGVVRKLIKLLEEVVNDVKLG